MEPPGKHGGRGMVFFDFSGDEMIYDEQILGALGLDESLASMGYIAVVRIRHAGDRGCSAPGTLSWSRSK
jgi:hypothetical protein